MLHRKMLHKDEDKNATYVLKDVPEPVGSPAVLSAMAG